MDIFLIIASGCLFAVLILGILVLNAQKRLDIPLKGTLLVDRQEERETPLLYFEIAEDPRTFTDGEIVKLRVKIVKPRKENSHVKRQA